MEMVGAYVSKLRGVHGLTQQQLANKVGVHVRTIRNIESGAHQTKPTDLAKVLQLLHGSWVHVSQLLQPDASSELVKTLVKDVTDGGFTDEQRAILEGLTPDQKAAILVVARQMQQ